ncbi:MAG: hypothetical protein EZS28_050065 [Streblomastix strix]|uniref:Uncharacterized protein n=1 Tax=Streblomastix strix TaxID=222440 RepID=A0A5J4T867_9EUKA|nr:MAG: hypothetical protein EZS28_050065 [Streblomastix strix]
MTKETQYEPTEAVLADFENARKFANKTHKKDVDWVLTRTSLTESFDDFFFNYIYVIVASGFRALTAARITQKLNDCHGDLEQMRKIFRNEQKIQAINTVWQKRGEWKTIRKTLTNVDSLKQFPRIGDIVKYHLARNIGLISCGKPDLHLVRYCEAHKISDPHQLINGISKKTGIIPGAADFMLWVWLSHSRGTKENACCNSEFILR